jgi:Zn finger protein HypA/HybF involved in hydrogenase expression
MISYQLEHGNAESVRLSMVKRWCDKCTEYVELVNGDELGYVCPTCKIPNYVDFSPYGLDQNG